MLVISEIIRKGPDLGMSLAVSKGLSGEHFKSLDAREIFEFMHTHYHQTSTLGELPIMKSLGQRFATYKRAAKSDAGLSTLIHELKLASMGSELTALSREFDEVLQDEDPEKAIDILLTNLPRIKLNFQSTHAFGAHDLLYRVKKRYKAAQEGLTMGLPWPWEPLNQDTNGKKKGGFYVLYGRMKSMKTWLAMKSAADDFKLHGARVLFWSGDMTQPESEDRFASILGEVDYQALKHGRLPRKVEEHCWKQLEDIHFVTEPVGSAIGTSSKKGDLIVMLGPTRPRSIPELKAAIGMYRPDIVYLDSFYKLDPLGARKGSPLWEKLTVLSEECKSLAVDMDIPLIVTHQANRSGEGKAGEDMTDLFGADRLAMEADLVMRIKRKKSPHELYEEDYEKAWEEEMEYRETRVLRKTGIDLMLRNNGVSESKAPTKALSEDAPKGRSYAEIAIIMGGNRDGVLDGFLIRCVPGYDYQVIDPSMDPKKVKAWLKQDEEQPAGAVKNKHETRNISKNQYAHMPKTLRNKQ